MKLNHVNLTVTNVPAAAAFLEKYFGLQNMGGNKGFTVLFDDDSLVLTLMKSKGETQYPETFHIGFGQETEESVNEINQRLKADGFDIQPPERSHAWTFYVTAPGGFMVEIFC